MSLVDISITSDSLRSFYPLNSFNDEELKLINNHARLNHLQKRELLFKEGSNDGEVIYLIRGRITLSASSGESFELDADSDQALYPVANLKPRRFSAKVASDNASIARIPAKVIEPFLASGSPKVQNNSIRHDSELNIFDSDWMMAMAKVPPFAELPSKQIAELFQAMQEIKVNAGDTIITQGEDGDYFYLVKKGQCLVSRNNGIADIPLGEIGPMGSFGEEALLGNTKRNATIRMLKKGRLMRINKADFQRFLKTRLINWIDPEEVQGVLDQGTIQVDLTQKVKPQKPIENALKIAPFMLRSQVKKLSRKNHYLLLCDNDNECAVASYLLSLRGLKSYVLRGGAESLDFC